MKFGMQVLFFFLFLVIEINNTWAKTSVLKFSLPTCNFVVFIKGQKGHWKTRELWPLDWKESKQEDNTWLKEKKKKKSFMRYLRTTWSITCPKKKLWTRAKSGKWRYWYDWVKVKYHSCDTWLKENHSCDISLVFDEVGPKNKL